MAAGDLWTAAVPVATQTGLGPVIAPYALIGIGFALSVSALTAVLVDTAPHHLAGMASGAANMLRDFGFTLGPAVIGAITLSQAAADIQAKLASDSALARQLAVFNASAAREPRAQAGGRRGELRTARRELGPESSEPAQERGLRRAGARQLDRLRGLRHRRLGRGAAGRARAGRRHPETT